MRIKIMEVPYIPKDAPFSGDQRAWLGGFLAGLHSRSIIVGESSDAVSSSSESKPIDILFGTQTGNSEELANDAGELARMRNLKPRVAELDSVSMEQLAKMDTLLVVVSTYGEGEMPDNAQLFWDALSASTAPRLETLEFAVLALGDTSYEHFCRAGKLVDTRLEQLGATRIASRLDCDVDFEEAAKQWLQATIPEGGAGNAQEEPAAVAKPGWSRRNPYPAVVVDNRNLSGPKSAKEIRHIAFSLADSELGYEAGDALGVMPVNCPELVQAWLDRLGANHGDAVPGKDETLGDLLSRSLEIRTPSQELLAGLEPLVKHQEFSYVLGGGDREVIDAFLWGKDTLDLLNLKPDLSFDLVELLGWLKPLQHRAYSISSSPKAHPGEVHLTVAAVRWTFDGREHKGVCSTYIADQAPEGQSSGIFMLPNKAFRIPQDNSLPMIMVGPGTGIAPFRAFLEERREIGAQGLNWLFFGDKHRESDFIYEEELHEMSKSGLLTRLDLAFSRDQSEKVYVQHRMRQNGADLFALLEEGAHFYVCGDATRMAKDVDSALHDVIVEHGNKTPDAAAEYVQELKRAKRYVRDVY